MVRTMSQEGPLRAQPAELEQARNAVGLKAKKKGGNTFMQLVRNSEPEDFKYRGRPVDDYPWNT